jgi:hypothetical protein
VGSDVKTLVTMTPDAQKALALKWMKVGFDCSTKGINGETLSSKKYCNLERMLELYFSAVFQKETK